MCSCHWTNHIMCWLVASFLRYIRGLQHLRFGSVEMYQVDRKLLCFSFFSLLCGHLHLKLFQMEMEIPHTLSVCGCFWPHWGQACAAYRLVKLRAPRSGGKKNKGEKRWPYMYIYLKFMEVNIISESDADSIPLWILDNCFYSRYFHCSLAASLSQEKKRELPDL